jgi:O-methyltransferase
MKCYIKKMSNLQSIISGDKLNKIIEMCKQVSHLPGDTAEVGVYKGGTSLKISQTLPEKTHHMFDTFSGIPIKSDKDIHDIGDFNDVSLDSIKESFKGQKHEFHIGLFPDTAKGLTQQFCLVHLDGDQYQTTLDGLELFYPRLPKGGVILLDDYKWIRCPGVALALIEFLKDKPEKLIQTVSCQAMIKKLNNTR